MERRLRARAAGLRWLIAPDGLRAELRELKGLVQSAEARIAASEQRSHDSIEGEIRRRQKVAWARIGDLRGYEARVRSQNGEDGILRELFRRIGTTNRFLVEFGVGSGEECNGRHLVEDQGWSALFLEVDPEDFAALEARWKEFPNVRCVQAEVTSTNIEELLGRYDVPIDLDLLGIDIDGNDYWVWKAVQHWKPRVVVIEYNAFHPPPERWVMTENPEHRWDHTDYFGASLTSLQALAGDKGYQLVGTDSFGVNSFFVRNDCVRPGLFPDPVLHYHYSSFGHLPHPRRTGPHDEG
jgi:hypothetical protein